MRVEKKLVVPYSVQEMFAIVEDINHYPAFLPWCERGEVLSRSDISKAGDYRRTTRIHIRQLLICTQFTSSNRCTVAKSLEDSAYIEVSQASEEENAQDPFRYLAGEWCFQPMGRSGSLGSRISVSMEYRFNNALVEKMLGQFFASAIESFAQAFVRRAHELSKLAVADGSRLAG